MPPDAFPDRPVPRREAASWMHWQPETGPRRRRRSTAGGSSEEPRSWLVGDGQHRRVQHQRHARNQSLAREFDFSETSAGTASAAGTNIAQGDWEYAMRAIVRVTATPPAAAKRWFCPSRSGNRAWPTNPRVIATTAGPGTPPVIPCSTCARATSGKLGQRRKIRTLKATVTTQVATSSRFARTASTRAPPGT